MKGAFFRYGFAGCELWRVRTGTSAQTSPEASPETSIGTSRRDFLGISALGLAAGVVANQAGAAVLNPAVANESGSAAAMSPAGDTDIWVWVTAGDERVAAAPKGAWVGAPA